LPSVTSSDNGKVLQVANGKWAAPNNVFNLTATYDSGVYKIVSPLNGIMRYVNRLLQFGTLYLNIQLTDAIHIQLIASGLNLPASKVMFVGYGPNADSNGELCRYSIVIDEDTDSTTELVINIEKLSSKELPDVTSSDNGKFLQVVNGEWAAASLTVYNGALRGA
jgi:hypothetical protein